MTVVKVGAAMGYAALVLVALLSPNTSVSVGVVWFLGVVALIHALECVLVWRWLREFEGPLAGHLAQTLLFGFLHWWPLRKAQKSAHP